MEENLKNEINYKFIVYCTINKVNKKIYIGVHKTTSTKFDGYLGCGVFVNKSHSYQKGETLFQRAVHKYGPNNFIRVTLATFNTAEEAYKRESELVNEEYLKRKDVYNTNYGGACPPHFPIKVYKYSLDGTYICEYNSIKEAAIANGIKPVTLGAGIRKGHASAGFLWSYEKTETVKPYTYPNAPKKIGVYDLNGNLLKTYDSVVSCRKDYCGCIHVLAGKRKTAKGCTFKYLS